MLLCKPITCQTYYCDEIQQDFNSGQIRKCCLLTETKLIQVYVAVQQTQQFSAINYQPLEFVQQYKCYSIKQPMLGRKVLG
ncbi:hypothetical protein GBAR_LOCUS22175, partial [Geodia barretti]